jgi:preprotein translocase subunit SecD
MKARFEELVMSKFMMWVAIALFGTYFLVSVRLPQGHTPFSFIRSEGISSFVKALYMPRIKLGIDLQGGTYFVLGVGVEKAIENKLGKERSDLNELFRDQKLKALPSNTEVKDCRIVYTFESEETAKALYYFLKKHRPGNAIAHNNYEVRFGLVPMDEQRMRSGVVDQAVNVLTNRLNGFGVSGLIVQRHGERQIVVQLPGVDDPERVKALITQSALLEFKIVEKQSYSEESLLDDFDGDVPSGKMVIKGRKGDDDSQAYLVSSYPDMTGDHIADARVGYDEYGKMSISFTLDSSGASIFKRLTGDNVGRQLGIVIDDIMYSAPKINCAIGGSGQISGNYTVEEARDLALVLKSGSLMAPLSFEQENRVGSSLGQDSIEKGMRACWIALLLVLLFSWLWYGIMGVLASIALAYNMFLILLILSYFEFTLTLPGIAGMVLTIGMAIDASILIYEKMREDVKAGLPFRQAIESGFGGVMGVIMDSNITTFLTGIILFKFGGPLVRGFAVTLMSGIVATLIAGIFFLKSLISWVVDLRNGRGLSL